jgi:hypothetical protein
MPGMGAHDGRNTQELARTLKPNITVEKPSTWYHFLLSSVIVLTSWRSSRRTRRRGIVPSSCCPRGGRRHLRPALVGNLPNRLVCRLLGRTYGAVTCGRCGGVKDGITPASIVAFATAGRMLPSARPIQEGRMSGPRLRIQGSPLRISPRSRLQQVPSP